MAEKKNVTRAQALEFAINIIQIAVENGITESDGVAETEVLSNMLAQVTKPRKAAVSKARKMNENLVSKIYDLAEGEVTTKDVVAFGLPEIATTQPMPEPETTTEEAAAVLRVACELQKFEKVTEGKKVAYKKVITE